MTAICCIKGFGCSQNDGSQTFKYTDDCIKIEFRFEVKLTYLQVYRVRVFWLPFYALLHHPQTDGNRTSVTIPGANFTENMTDCNPDKTSGDISITWPENFVLTLNFNSVSDRCGTMMPLLHLLVCRLRETIGISVASSLSTPLMETDVILKTHSVSCKCAFAFTFTFSPDDGDTLIGTTGITKIGWNNSYSCSSNNDNFNLMSEDSAMNQSAEIIVRSIKIQVFNFPNKGEFSQGN